MRGLMAKRRNPHTMTKQAASRVWQLRAKLDRDLIGCLLAKVSNARKNEIPIRDRRRYRAAWAIAVLVALHAAGALKHHFISRDDVLKRMLPRFRHGRD